MERGITMLFHSLIIGIIAYIIMIFIGVKNNIAENRSLIIMSTVLIYMIVFGHGLPTSINKNI